MEKTKLSFVSIDVEKNMKELNSRLRGIYNEHRSKDEKIEYLQSQLEEKQVKHECALIKQNQQFQSRIVVYEQRIKQQDKRIETYIKRNNELEKENCDSLFRCNTKNKKLIELTAELEISQKNIEILQIKLYTADMKKKKLKYDWHQSLKTLKIAQQKLKIAKDQKAQTFNNLQEAHKLQKTVTDLMRMREKETYNLHMQLKQIKNVQTTFEAQLRKQFQEELDRYIRIRDGQYKEERKELTEVLKEDKKKSLVNFKEAITTKNHDIENLKESNRRLKYIIQNLKKKKEEASKSQKQWELKFIKLKEEKGLQLLEKDKLIKNKELFLQELRGKYMKKTLEMREILKKLTNLTAELSVYRKFIQNEEEIFGLISKKRNNISADFPINKKQKVFLKKNVGSQFELGPFDLKKGELFISNLLSTHSSLFGWALLNNDHSKRFDLPDQILTEGQRLRILIGQNARKENYEDILWLEDAWTGEGWGCVQLIDPVGIIRSSIKVSNETVETKK